MSENQTAVAAPRRPKPPKPAVRWVCFILAALGWWLSCDLLRMGYGGAASNPWLASQCSASAAGGDCQSALNSEWGSIPLSPKPGAPRLPRAAMGMGYFALLVLWFGFIGLPTRFWGWGLALLGLLLAANVESLRLTLIMANELGRWCAGCVAVHVINAAILLMTIIGQPWRRIARDFPPFPSPRLALATLSAGAFAWLGHLLFALLFIANGQVGQLSKLYEGIISDPEFARWDFARQKPTGAFADIELDWDGPADAPHRIVVFSDAQCPRCKNAHEIVTDLMQRRPGEIRVAYLHMPLDRSCNEKASRTMHFRACLAARAIEAARALAGPEGARRLRDALFLRQSEIESSTIEDWAAWAELDGPRLRETMDAPEVAARIQRDVELVHRLQLIGAPTIYLDDKRFDYWRSPEVWETLLGEETANHE